MSPAAAAAVDFTGGVQAAVAKASGKPALLTVPGAGGGPVQAFDPLSQAALDTFIGQAQQLEGGIFVAASVS